MLVTYPTNGKPLLIRVTVTPTVAKAIRVLAFDQDAPNTRYFDWNFNLRSPRQLRLKFPVTPNNMVLVIAGTEIVARRGGEDRSLRFSDYSVEAGKPCNAWMSGHSRKFDKFMSEFNQKASYLPPGEYRSSDGEFLIKYLPQIVDYQTKRVMTTPARIGHKSGTIEINREQWLRFTFPARQIISMHEYAHKWENEASGTTKDDEIGADLNAIYKYMGQGYPGMEARQVFAHVFYRAQTPLNIDRLNIINDYIDRFERGDIIPGCS
ncbi:MAG TPA: hypothetical protein PKZ07_14660 [Sedimentisphaerales bacterium]|nr:hypothetical protein [Sedimentisphaerales bacterium]